MTLSSFKHKSKFLILIAFLIAYGVSFYFLGSSQGLSKLKDLQNILKIRGASSKNEMVKPVDSPVPFADTQSTSVIASYVKHCANTKNGFEVAYPKDWFTTYNIEDEKCTYFAPYSFTVPASTDKFSVPVKIEIQTPDNWPGVIKYFENPNDFQNIISTKNVEINGKAVEKITAVATGAGQIPKGHHKLSFLYFDSRLPLVFTYEQIDPQENTEEIDRIIEDMVKSLRYF